MDGRWPLYCALGALLRWADVSPADIARADELAAIDFWERWGALLEREYGIPGFQSAHRIVTLNLAVICMDAILRDNGWPPVEPLAPLRPSRRRRRSRPKPWRPKGNWRPKGDRWRPG